MTNTDYQDGPTCLSYADWEPRMAKKDSFQSFFITQIFPRNSHKTNIYRLETSLVA